ncbi:hypothetical protein TWF694_006353 [Orbilia ellipsospora]|uniref:HNH nuclease domain-containing protein n=1 Tax=Orbilia ellipsospora TaxID=2528407 RepID=A0AAV9XK87_9PEZI
MADSSEPLDAESLQKKEAVRKLRRKARKKALAWMGFDEVDLESVPSRYSTSTSGSVTPRASGALQIETDYIPGELDPDTSGVTGREYKDGIRLLNNPQLREFKPRMYTNFVEALLEDAIWRLESRLIYDKWNRVPKDVFNKLADDPQEGLPGYGFLSDERNKGITARGIFDILGNYARISTAKPHPAWRYNPSTENIKPPKSVRFVEKSERKDSEDSELVKQFGKTPAQKEADRIGQLLIDAGLRPNPGDVAIKELAKGEYPIPGQYYTDMQAFLESILCLLVATCPQVLDTEDYISLSFANTPGRVRTLRFENNNLIILSFDIKQDTCYRTIIPGPLSRLVLIYLIDVRPFTAFLATNPDYEQPHWRQDWLFPSSNGGSWTMERLDSIMRRETKAKMMCSLGVKDFRAVYHHLQYVVGEGWLQENEYHLEGDREPRCEIRWSKERPEEETEGHPGGRRYAQKHFLSSSHSPVGGNWFEGLKLGDRGV